MADYDASSSEEDMRITTAVAIDRDKNSQHAVKWASENLRLRDKQIVLLHVNTRHHLNLQSGVSEEVHVPTNAELQRLFLPYRGFCARKGIRTKEVVLDDIDIANALCEYVAAKDIFTIVLGAPSRSAIARAFRTTDVPTCVAKSVPDSCTVYVASKGKAQKIKSANESLSPQFHRQSSRRNAATDQQRVSLDGSKNTSPVSVSNVSSIGRLFGNSASSSENSMNSNEYQHMFRWEKRHDSKNSSPVESENNSCNSSPFESNYNSPENSRSGDTELECMTPQTRQVASRNYALQQSMNYPNLRGRRLDISVTSASGSSDNSEDHSVQSDIIYEHPDQQQTWESSRSSISSQTSEIEDELRRMKLDLKQLSEMYNAACREAVTAKETVRDIVQWKSEAAIDLGVTKHAQEVALAIVEREKQKCKAAVEIAQKARHIAELESQRRKHAELKFKQESKERQKAMEALTHLVRYRRYTIDEIEVATNNFSTSDKIGEGGYGPVYKATLDYTPVAIKVLRSDISEGQKQFQREVEVLSQMRHPHMVILLGACPEYGCLIYEYMENGCLEDRLNCKDGTPPLPWRTRFRIAAEIATALNFLHQTRPEPLVHRDLKPANILLDRNYVSKISDVGLSRLVPPSLANSITQYRMTAAAGTFCYIDPEYQQTGMLCTKSDIYSLGVLLLQIITAKSPMGLTYQVESAIEMGHFEEILDQTVKDWPVDEALSLAQLALRCCELRGKDRPDLNSVILPELMRLRDRACPMKPDGRFYMYPHGLSSQDSSYASQETRTYTFETEEENKSKLASGSGSSTITTLESQ